jgi:hypothetical protein
LASLNAKGMGWLQIGPNGDGLVLVQVAAVESRIVDYYERHYVYVYLYGFLRPYRSGT